MPENYAPIVVGRALLEMIEKLTEAIQQAKANHDDKDGFQ
jgi:hypothetical protein